MGGRGGKLVVCNEGLSHNIQRTAPTCGVNPLPTAGLAVLRIKKALIWAHEGAHAYLSRFLQSQRGHTRSHFVL